ncbi:MAG: phosphoribosylglycinamide formyltransferase [Cryomorphaceae bacterium]
MGVTRLAIFASGTGTNASSIIQYFQNDPAVEVSIVVTNKSDAGVIGVAERAKVEFAIITKQDLGDEELMMALLEEYRVDVIVLAGWLLLVPPYLIERFEGRILNIHPALLPKFGGKGMWGKHVHQAVKDSGDLQSGITIHMVNAEYDKGKVLAQHKVELKAGDDPADIEAKVRKLELHHYPIEIKKFVDSI